MDPIVDLTEKSFLINNAGITRPAMIAKMTPEQWQPVIDVHLTGSFHCLRPGRDRLAHTASLPDANYSSLENYVRYSEWRHGVESQA